VAGNLRKEHSMSGEDGQARQTHGWTWWSKMWDLVADVPWGVFGFAALLWLLVAGRLSADQAAALGAASGLLAIGHGIHTGTRHLK
jgi:hypothetical protein